MNKKKIAICISGGIKFHQKGLATIEKISSMHDVKVFIHTWNVKDISSYDKNSWHGSLANHGNVSKISDVLQEFPIERIVIDDFETKKIHFENLLKECSPNLIFRDRKDIGIISMFYSIWKSHQVKNEVVAETGETFDCVIRMRFDSDLKSLENFNVDNLENGNVHIPVGQDWNGLNDQFAYGTSDSMNIYSSLILNFRSFRNITYNPEVLLKHYLRAAKINVIRQNITVNINNT
jgi:hypothetical protein